MWKRDVVKEYHTERAEHTFVNAGSFRLILLQSPSTLVSVGSMAESRMENDGWAICVDLVSKGPEQFRE